MRFDGASTRTTPKGWTSRFCWCGRFLHRNERLQPPVHSAQQLTVLYANPPQAAYSLHIVLTKQAGKIHRNVLVKQDAHRPIVNPAPARVRLRLAPA